MYDVIVVGAGPVGSYTACQLAESGFKVAIFEEDESVGENVICAGIIGKEIFERFSLPQEAILSRIESVSFFSPSLFSLKYKPSDTLAYVVDRGIFDKNILARAIKSGVEVHLNSRVEKIKIGKDFGQIEVYKDSSLKKIQAVSFVLATGVSYKLQQDLGMGSPPAFFQGAQVEAEVEALEQTEIYLGRKISPGSFAWVVPLNDFKARVGVLANNRGAFYLKNFLQKRLKERIKEENLSLSQKRIAYGAISKTFAERVLAVGEAGGQVKTTTGGGIAYGLLCSEVACDVLKKSFKRGDFSERRLSEYEKLWKSKIGKELKIGCTVRKIVEKLTDSQIDKVFKFLQRRKELKRLIEKRVNFDYHSGFLSFGLRVLKGFI
ncbi:MAG: NAD(P)/FAD-dependent oxidoreductase [Candidatus Aerophobetes bacterium]|nr:NAD(P)/FAD-dependent oxidoreductase [Candidatus Aerophobetes bacterium]